MDSFGFVVMSEDMVKDGYEDIMNIDISSVAIDMMTKKHEFIPQLRCILSNEIVMNLESYFAFFKEKVISPGDFPK